MLRVVPATAGAVLVTGALVRLMHLPLAIFWIALVVATLGVALFAWLKGRVPVVNDAAAAQLDADGILGGELRSAHWFATHPHDNAWVHFHLAGAERTLDEVSWAAVYPPVRGTRVWAGSAVMAVAAIALALSSAWSVAERRGPMSSLPRGAATGRAASPQAVSAELQKQIEDLIKAVQSGAMPIEAARAKLSEMRNALADLDPKLQQALAAATKGAQPSDWNAEDPDPKVADLASRAQKAAASGDLPQDMKWSLQDLAEKLAGANRPSTKPETDKAQQAADGKSSGAPEAGAGQKMQEAGVQMTRNTGADAQSNQMMTTSSPLDGMMKVDPRGADGGGPKNGSFQPLDLAALRKETIRADTDSQGANVLAELRRKSEQSRSTIAFSHVAPLAAYDKSHASAPPTPPDALRPLVRQYFIRR